MAYTVVVPVAIETTRSCSDLFGPAKVSYYSKIQHHSGVVDSAGSFKRRGFWFEPRSARLEFPYCWRKVKNTHTLNTKICILYDGRNAIIAFREEELIDEWHGTLTNPIDLKGAFVEVQ